MLPASRPLQPVTEPALQLTPLASDAASEVGGSEPAVERGSPLRVLLGRLQRALRSLLRWLGLAWTPLASLLRTLWERLRNAL